MKTNEDFAKYIEGFFSKYLITIRGCSQESIRSYRDAIFLLIEYFETILHIKADKITIGDINSENILGFLKWLEDVKKVKIQTRNHRLNVLR